MSAAGYPSTIQRIGLTAATRHVRRDWRTNSGRMRENRKIRGFITEMSQGTESKASVKARNAKPARAKLRSAQGNLWEQQHPERAAAYKRASRERLGDMAQMIETARDPILFEADNVALTCDFHVPFHDEDLIKTLIDAATEHDTKILVIDGDFLDCDNVSKFNSITEAEQD